jgi:hypothetical protein
VASSGERLNDGHRHGDLGRVERIEAFVDREDEALLVLTALAT